MCCVARGVRVCVCVCACVCAHVCAWWDGIAKVVSGITSGTKGRMVNHALVYTESHIPTNTYAHIHMRVVCAKMPA